MLISENFIVSATNVFILDNKSNDRNINVYFSSIAGNHAALILSSHHEIRRYQLDTYRYSLLLEQEVSSAVAIDFDIRNEMLFWTDVESEKVYS